MIIEIKIKYLKEIEPIKHMVIGDWLDLRCAEDTVLKRGEFKYIPLGVSMELPLGYEAIIVPRSSTFKNYGIIQTNGVGVIDETYCGPNDEWHFPALAVRDTFIPKNTRICQFRLLNHQPSIIFNVSDLTHNKDRGGLGSTGKN